MSEKRLTLSLNHWLLKLLALVLAMVSGGALVLGGVGWLLEEPVNLYDRLLDDYRYSNLYNFSNRASRALVDRYAWEASGVDAKLYERFFHWGSDVDAAEELEYEFHYTIENDESGKPIVSTLSQDATYAWVDDNAWDIRTGSVTVMPKCDYYPSYKENGAHYKTQAGDSLPPLPEGITDYEYYVVSEGHKANPTNISRPSYSHASAGGEEYTIYRIEYGPYIHYRVNLYMTETQMAAAMNVDGESRILLDFVAEQEQNMMNCLLWGGIGLLIALLWLALTAGRTPRNDTIEAGGLNIIPLDLYLLGAGAGLLTCAVLVVFMTDELIRGSFWNYYESVQDVEFLATLGLMALGGAGAGLIGSMFVMACAAQMKMGGNHWAKNTLVAHCWRFGWKAVVTAWRWCWTLAKGLLRAVVGCFAWMRDLSFRFTALLPLSWQWLIASGCLWILMFLCVLIGLETYSIVTILFGVVVTVLLVLYGAYCFGRLRDTAKKMSQGNLEAKIENRFLRGCFGEFADHLNALGDVCMESARNQIKSERMKSELITNVSHDIKTPLTSIINYVDLLQKTDDAQERAEYLEVLDRQSQKLKKLIEDLMEMSKATSGNVSVEITPTDVTEAVHQALGEFADTLSACGLQVMLRAPEEPLMAACDGKHLWRVLSNTLSNVVKYAMPGTRVYVDVAREGQTVEISMKNISNQMLNISAEELMERFVRGDSSRNTEGNGLGLNIAKSLMEVQGGSLNLVVDGDLFKVILTLPAA